MASNLPPGCTHGNIEAHFADRPCEVCGYYPDDCVCPECPECGGVGDPQCYPMDGIVRQLPGPHHGLTVSWDQKIGRCKRRIEDLQDLIAAEGQYLDWLEQQKLLEEQGLEPEQEFMN